MMTLIIFLIVLSVLVVVHEFGHFITARKAGMKVYEFGIGFPPRLGGVYKDPKTGKFVWVWGRGKNSLKETVGGEDREHPDEFPSTLYSINWLPLGGFVKIKGENGEAAKDPDSFGSKKTWQKVVVLVAGVTMNILLAAVLLGFGFMIGLPTDVTNGVDSQARIVEAPAVVIQQVEPESPAAQAGLQMGDKIISIDGESIENSQEMIAYVQEHGSESLDVTIARGEETQTLTIEPKILEEGSAPRLGVMLADAAIVNYPWYIALYKGFVAAFIGLINIFISFYLLIKGLILGQGMAFELSGPVGIASIVGQSARLGIQYLINVTAMISLSLAAINILPIPALDGGRLLFVLIEKVIRRPVPLKYEQFAHTIGFLLLMALIVVITVRDVKGLF